MVRTHWRVIMGRSSTAPDPERHSIKPCDIAIDTVTNAPMFVVGQASGTAVDHDKVWETDRNRAVGMDEDDAVFNCVYLPDDSDISPPNKPYQFPESRLVRYQVEMASEMITDPRVQQRAHGAAVVIAALTHILDANDMDKSLVDAVYAKAKRHLDAETVELADDFADFYEYTDADSGGE